MPWSLTVPVANDMLTDELFSALDNMTEKGEEGTWTFSMSNGVDYVGKGYVVGDLKTKSKEAKMDFKVMGGGKLSKLG